MFESIKNWFKDVWSWIFSFGVMLIAISFISYLAGYTANWALIGWLLIGIWAIHYSIKRFNLSVKFATSLFVFSSIAASIVLTALVYGNHTLLDIYHDWGTNNRTLFGFIRIFAPIIGITVASFFLAILHPSVKVARRIAVICIILSSLALLMFPLVNALDKKMHAKKHYKAEEYNRDAVNIKRETGSEVVVIVDKTAVYDYDERTNLFTASNDKLNSGERLPVVTPYREMRDGPNTLILIFLPDSEGDFNSTSPQKWIRLNNAQLVKKQVAKLPKSKSKSDNEKIVKARKIPTKTYKRGDDPIFKIAKGHYSPHWIRSTTKVKGGIQIQSMPGSEYELHFKNGHIVRMWKEEKPPRIIRKPFRFFAKEDSTIRIIYN